MKTQSEKSIHNQVAQYLKNQYPQAIFRTDFSAGVRMTIGQAKKHNSLQSGRGYPDLFIAAPRGEYHGLFLELKRDGTTIYKRDGDVVANEHIREQKEILDHLNRLGYYAVFAVGFDKAKDTIDWYMRLK